MADFSKLNINDNTYDVKDSAARASITALQSEMPDKEDVSNKVTSMSAASTDTEYPSAKAVYDAIAESEKWIQVTLSTTPSEVADILSANKIPYLYITSRIYIFMAELSSRFVFQNIQFTGSGALYTYNLDKVAGTWYTNQWGTVTSISSTYTNYHIPTAKAVYDALQARTLYWHDIMLNKASGSSEPDFSVRVRLLLTSNTQITSATAFRDVMVSSQGRYVPVAASGSAYNSSNERINVLQVSAEELSFSYVGTITFYGINENLGAWENRTMTCTNNDFSVTDTVVGVW